MVGTAADLFQKVRKTLGKPGFVGVDIGSSSIKIVQLGYREGVIRLLTYGEITNPMAPETGMTTAIFDAAAAEGSALADLVHEVNASSRICGVAIPLSEAFIQKVDVHKRDPEQMQKIMPLELKRFVPATSKDVRIDWYALPEKEADAFDVHEGGHKVESSFQKVMIVAVNVSGRTIGHVEREANMKPEFYELEMFSVARSCSRYGGVPTVILDLGASSTKAYRMSDDRKVLAAHAVPIGGWQLTQAVMKALNCDQGVAERVKCEQGLLDPGPAGEAIAGVLEGLWTFALQMIDEARQGEEDLPQRIILVGGGASLPGLLELAEKRMRLPVEIGDAFSRTKGPMILERVLREDAPSYAVAVGLALRGLGK